MKLTEKELERFWDKVRKRGVNECWFWTASVYKNGYGQFWLHNSGQGAHRVAWMIENKCDVPADKPYVLHSCNNPSCCNPNHLRIGTQQENMDDMIKDGRQNKPKGEVSGRSKLTNQQVVEIYLSAEDSTALANKYNVSSRQIQYIQSGESREWLTKDLKPKPTG